MYIIKPIIGNRKLGAAIDEPSFNPRPKGFGLPSASKSKAGFVKSKIAITIVYKINAVKTLGIHITNIQYIFLHEKYKV
jgi:hypothetical protein